MQQSPLPVGDDGSFTREAGRAPWVPGRFLPSLFILGFAVFLHLGFGLPASGVPASGVVVKVFDGDTVLLGSGEKVRYLGIDAPEVAHGNTPADCHGLEAKALNERLVLRQRVDLRYDGAQIDSHGRLLAYVHLPDGRCVNSELVLQGCAVVFRSAEGFSRFHELLAHQKAAIRSQRGLWGQCRVKPSDHYLGNRRSYVFHRPDCPFGRQTGSRNRVHFDSRMTAFEAGFSPCRRCRP